MHSSAGDSRRGILTEGLPEADFDQKPALLELLVNRVVLNAVSQTAQKENLGSYTNL